MQKASSESIRSAEHAKPASLSGLLDRIESAARDHQEVAIEEILDAVGRRSFSPILLLAGLIMMAPVIGDIPGVPVLMGLIVVIAAAQMMLGRAHIWVPHWLASRSVASDKLTKVLSWLRKPARFADSHTRPRLEWVVRRVFIHVIAVTCMVIAATTPALELVPFSANLAGLAIAAFALALFARDGLIALVAMLFSICVLGLLLWQLF